MRKTEQMAINDTYTINSEGSVVIALSYDDLLKDLVKRGKYIPRLIYPISGTHMLINKKFGFGANFLIASVL